jgi:molecular chaperone DnaK
VLATHGDTFLGGDDIDLALAVSVAQDFQRRTGVDVRKRAADWRQLLLACEEAKRTLSRQSKTRVTIEGVAHLDHGPSDLDAEIDREHLDRLATPYVQQTVEIMDEAITMAGIEKKRLDQVLLVGGSSRLPQVRRMVQEAFATVPLVDIDPETAVCIGAAATAYRAAGGTSPTLQRAHSRVVEVVPRSFGLATAGGGFDPVIARNTPLPARGSRVYTTWRDDQKEMHFVVLQGDSERASECTHLGEFVVSDLPAGPAGHVELELVFEVGHDGLLEVSARNTSTGEVYRMGIHVDDGTVRGR